MAKEGLQGSVSQGASTSHQGVKTAPGHNFQPLLVTLGPMTHEVTRRYEPSSLSFFLFLFSPPADPVREKLSLTKLFQPPSRPAWSRTLKPSKRQRCKTLPKNFSTKTASTKRLASSNTTTGATSQQDHLTGLRTSTFFLFSWTGNTARLNNYTMLCTGMLNSVHV